MALGDLRLQRQGELAQVPAPAPGPQDVARRAGGAEDHGGRSRASGRHPVEEAGHLGEATALQGGEVGALDHALAALGASAQENRRRSP